MSMDPIISDCHWMHENIWARRVPPAQSAREDRRKAIDGRAIARLVVDADEWAAVVVGGLEGAPIAS